MDNSKVVFISHSSNDDVISEQLYQAIENKGIGCWIDKYDITPGIPYARAIMNGLNQSQAMVVLVSAYSVKSDDVLNEIDAAHKAKKLIIPVFIENIELPNEYSYYLNRRQWITYKGDLGVVADAICEALRVHLGTTINLQQKAEPTFNTASSLAQYNLKIKPNLDCNVLIDEDDKGLAKADTITRFPLIPGEYTLACVSISQKVRLDLEDVVISNGDVLRKPTFEIKPQETKKMENPTSSKSKSTRPKPQKDSRVVVTKPHLNLITIGHENHGKTTLCAAISKVQGEKRLCVIMTYDAIDYGKEKKEDYHLPYISSEIEYQTDIRHYIQADFKSHKDLVNCTFSRHNIWSGAVLVVDVCDGPMRLTKEHLLLANMTGISDIVVFLNKCELIDDEDLVDLVEMETRDLLNECGFDGDNTPIIRGSALGALNGEPSGVRSVECLLEAVDSWIPQQRLVDKPFLMPIEDVFFIEGRGTVATGRIETGVINTGDAVDIIGMGAEKLKSTVTGVEMFRKILDQGEAGDNVGLLLRGIDNDEFSRGMIVCDSSVSQFATTNFEAIVYSLEIDGLRNKDKCNIHIRTQQNLHCVVSLPDNQKKIEHNNYQLIQIQAKQQVLAVPGTRFLITKGTKDVAVGIIV